MKSLSKIKFMIAASLSLLFLAACKKDPGSYKYHSINEARVAGLDSLYVVNAGESPNITPKVSYTQDEIGDPVNYSYQWLMIGKEGKNGSIPTALDSGLVFKAPVNLSTGIYNMLYRITDKRTGVWTEYPFKIFVTLKTYEGWLLLSEINGQKSRLDMMSYQTLSKTFTPLIDVLAITKSGLTLTGLPNFISYSRNNIGAWMDGIIISTTKEATYLGPDTLEYRKVNNFSTYMSGPDKATDAGAKLEGTSLYAYMTVNGNVYYAGFKSKYTRINKVIATGKFFKSAPYVSFTGDNAIVFDEDNSRFLWCPEEAYGFYAYAEPRLNNLDKTLMFMARTTYNGGETFAILKGKTDEKVYLARLTTTKLNYLEEITGTGIGQAEQIAVNSDFGYVFYNVGGKIYEYDYALGLNKEMADYGNRKISLLKFQDVQSGTKDNASRYAKMRNQLIVCSYEAGNLDNSGTMDIYNVPGINGQLTKANTFTNLGKVVSVTYRSR